MITSTDKINHLNWLDPLKALALLAILFNHLVEEFYSPPLFTNIFPFSPIQFLGWLGDFGPGVFVLVSGIGLTWATLHRSKEKIDIASFFRRRLIRIFPLYIGIHFIFLISAVFLPDSILRHSSAYPMTLANPKMLLSIFGLRFTDSLFYYISPAWWFVWLIIQLYLLFPFLYILMNRVGIKWFLIITFAFTFISRILGLEGIRYSGSIYIWMMGIFFGTRLAEFCAGMAIAALLIQSTGNAQRLPGISQILAWSLPIYVLGLACSRTWAGNIVSHLLITLGMTGIFYALWEGLIKKVPVLAGIIVWIGLESYSVYLIHQPPLKLTSVLFHNSIELHLITAVTVLMIAFPVGYLINKIVTRLVMIGKELKGNDSIRSLSFVVALLAALTLILLEPSPEGNHRPFSLIIGLSVIFLIFSEYASVGREKLPEYVFRWTIILASLLKLSIFHTQLGTAVALTAGFVAAFFAGISYKYSKSSLLAWSATLASLVILISVLELTLWYFAPREAGRWGELPALEQHKTRIFSLKPNLVKRLRYNNYDYVIRTNSLGLASPAITIDRPTPDTLRILIIGDAFSMPEGIQYEHSFPALLENRIADYLKHRRIQVINAGVTAYGPVEQYPQLNELGPLLRPDIVVYQFFINEFSDVNANPEGILRSAGLISCFTSGYCNYAERSQIVRRIGKAVYFLIERITKKPLKRHYEKALLKYYRKGDNHLYDKETLTKLCFYLDSMKKVCNNINSRFVIYFVPGAVTVSKPSDIAYFPWDQDLSDQEIYDLERPLRNLKKIADDLDIPVVDLTPYLKKHPNQPVYFPRSWHWNEEGHLVVARVIEKDLARRGWLDLPKIVSTH